MNDFFSIFRYEEYLISFVVFILFLTSSHLQAQQQKVADIVVRAGSSDHLYTPVSIDMYDFEPGTDQFSWLIYEVTPAGRIRKASQMNGGESPKLWWILDGLTAAGTTRIFELVRSKNTPENSLSVVSFTDDGKKLLLKCGARPVVAYQHTMLPAPEGASGLYARSAFIHPLYSPQGAVLTRVNPPDHLHHMGLWNPWTKTEFEGRTIDFWNLNKGQGTVRFDHFISTESGDVFGGFRALQEHVDLSAPGGEKAALRELLDIRVWNIGENAWLIDYTTMLNCADTSAFLIEKYRYQGFGFRAIGEWNDENCQLVTSGGFDKSNANATRAKWCDISGPTKAGRSGIVFMTSPANHNFPEQLRIWPVGANDGKENVFFNFNPAQDSDWLLLPGQVYTLHYRMYVYDGTIQDGVPERLWNDFAHPPLAEVKKILLHDN